MMRAASLLALLALVPQEKGPLRIEWKLPAGRAAEFAILDRAGKPLQGRSFLVFGSELTPQGNRLAVDAYDQIAYPFLFQLPGELSRGAAAWEHTATFFVEGPGGGLGALFGLGGTGLRPVCARGRYVARASPRKGEEGIVTIDGSFTFYEIRRERVNNQPRLTVSKNAVGSLATSVQVSAERGMIVKAGYQLKIRGQKRVVERDRTRIEEQNLSLHEILEFREEIELDPAKLKDPLDGAVRKAADWLRRQPRGPGFWGTARALESPRAQVDLTGLVVRALLAAGAGPDDPAIVAAARHLRSTLPATPQGFNHSMVALALKDPSKEEAAAIQQMAKVLLQKRDPRRGWGLGGRDDAENPVSTAHAVEALAHAGDAVAGDEVWKDVLEHLSSTWIEGNQEVELDLEFEEGEPPIAPDPKKVFPATWPVETERRGRDDFLQAAAPPGGNALGVLSALKGLLIASGRLKLDDRQRTSLDTALRKGLAYLQGYWTLRIVPPAEGAWCLQRYEYLDLLAQVLKLARVAKVSGADWRLEGAFLLLREQRPDGAWDSGQGLETLETARALLFLSAARSRTP